MRAFVLALVTSGGMAILAGTPASADELPARPLFGMMDNTADGTELVLDVATIPPTGDADFVLLRPRLHMQHVAANGVGAYGGIAAGMRVSGSDMDRIGLGDLEFGALYQRALSTDLAIAARAGLICDTATDDGVFANVVATMISRPGDIATATPTTWLRLGVSPTYVLGTGFARIDAGVDIPVGEGSRDTIQHVNVGAGLTADRWSFTAELGGVRLSNNVDSDIVVVAGLAARYRGRSTAPYVMLSTPIHDEMTRAGGSITLTVGVAVP